MKYIIALIATLVLCGCNENNEDVLVAQIEQKNKEIELLKGSKGDPAKYIQLKEETERKAVEARLLPKITEFKGGSRHKVYYFALPDGSEFGEAIALFFESHEDEELITTAGDSKGIEVLDNVDGRRHVATRHKGYWVFTRKIE